MFVLRSKVKIADVTDTWTQYGVWGRSQDVRVPAEQFALISNGDSIWVRIDNNRYLVVSKDQTPPVAGNSIAEERWAKDEILSVRPLITAVTQDLFVPQMVNFEKIGGIDFQKGCYPGQEIGARAQYRGEVKRRMKRL